ncbi:PREDICTED: coiled-coil domain-containing protein 180 isoform X2 [Crocodylus porosus]|nr:PREDICTED: coiled-coil domain-containing protein 180 isoform X2 [Crocodylus porosus]
MVLVGEVGVVPSGKIYRQIFDDEVRLVRSLEQGRNRAAQHKCPVSSAKIPLVKDLETCAGKGLLSPRQQKWVEGMPYDDFTENPVFYKEATVVQKVQESEDVIAAQEVRGLADLIIPEKTSSNIIERLSKGRQGRHNEAVVMMQQELACIGREMEHFILETETLLLTKLSESNRKIELLLKKIECDSDLEAFSIESFGQLWDDITQDLLHRRQWIREMDETLNKYEVARAEKIKDVLKKCTKILEDIAYLLPPDIHRFVHNEAMMINQALLANRRAIAKLFVNLMEADLKKELSLRFKWQDRVKDWKIMQKDYVVHSFRKFMASEEIQNPPEVKRDLENMKKEQISLDSQRMKLLQHLSDFLPSTHKKAEINEWYESLTALNKRIDTHNVQCMMRIRLHYERVWQECLTEVQKCKNKLLNLKVCTEEEAEKVVNPEFFQLIGNLQSQFEEELEQMDIDFEDLAKLTEQNCKDLYKYFQEALVLWDVHQLNLTQQENELQMKLKGCRQKHENQNQIQELNLDIILDKLRTQSNEGKLTSHLESAFSSLDDIRAGYKAYHQDIVERVAAYPEAILKELIAYSTSISQYFNVKEVFQQGLPEETGSASEEQELVEESETENTEEQQKAESFARESEEAEQSSESLQLENEETNAGEDKESLAQEAEETEKQGAGKSSAQGSEGTDQLEESDNFAQQREEAEIFEDEENQECKGDDLQGILPEITLSDCDETESSEIIAEVFFTTSGNAYSVISCEESDQTKTKEICYIKLEKKDPLPMYLKHVLIPDSLLEELKKRIRLGFFEHLEMWFAQSLSNACIIVTAKKEELNSELQLRLHLHEPRHERIEKEIHDVRAAELAHHRDRLESHCTALMEALNKEKSEFLKIREHQSDISKEFRALIQDMESIFLAASNAEKLISLSNILHSEMRNHVEVIQISLRSYRNYLEEALRKLRDSNMDFLKSCRLFSEGGNFSSEEVELFCKRLEQETARIDFVEGIIMGDMEKMESNYLEQANEVIGKFESKFHYLAVDRLFMDKIQRFLTNLQVKIKSEVANSNLQAQTLNSYLEKFLMKIDACAHPTADKEAVTAEELFDFAKVVMKEMKKRSKYLDCLVVPTLVLPEIVIQGSLTAAVRTESLREENKVMVMGIENTPLLNPSRMGKPAVDDVAVSVIKNLLQIQQPKKSIELRHERDELTQSKSIATHLSTTTQKESGLNMVNENIQTYPSFLAAPVAPKKSVSVNKKLSDSSIHRYSRPTRTDKKFQIFGEKLQDPDHFKGILTDILWKANDTLLYLAEEFYRKDKHQITRPDYLQETFEQCAEVLGQKLLSYQAQTDDYYNSCLREFRDQLKLFEEQLPHVSHLAIDSLLEEHEEQLRRSMDQIRHLYRKQTEAWDNAKIVNKNKLRPALGHPDNLSRLKTLCEDEEKRHKDQVDGIHVNTQKLQACATACAQKFVSALASLTERMLLEFDECITVDEVQEARPETPKEKISTLIRRKQAGLPLEIHESKLLAERKSRTWPEIPATVLTDAPDYVLCRETASVTTAKTTVGHLSAAEARDAAYMKYKQRLDKEFACIKEESTAQLMKAQHWEDWWKQSIQKIKQLYV